MTKITPEYTAVDLSSWARKEHFEVFQSFAQCTINQTVQLDITAEAYQTGWLEILSFDYFPYFDSR